MFNGLNYKRGYKQGYKETLKENFLIKKRKFILILIFINFIQIEVYSYMVRKCIKKFIENL